jgi:hypothetical protein
LRKDGEMRKNWRHNIGEALKPGTRINEVLFHEGDLWFSTPDGFIKAEPEGDCCASCYVQHIDGADALQGATVAEVESIELPPVPDSEQCDVSDVWGHKIRTDKGHCTIEMRVDHNGYYGGELVFYAVDHAPPEAAKRLDDF